MEARLTRLFDCAFTSRPASAPFDASGSYLDVIAVTPAGLHLSYSNRTAEWMAAVAAKPADTVALVRAHLDAALADATTPIGQLAADFAAEFAALVSDDLDEAVTALSLGTARLRTLVSEVLPVLGDDGSLAAAAAADACHDALFSLCDSALRPPLRAAHAAEDAAVSRRIEALEGLLPRHLGLDARFWLDVPGAAGDAELPYAAAIEAARQLSRCASPRAKLASFVDACAAAARCAEQQASADEERQLSQADEAAAGEAADEAAKSPQPHACDQYGALGGGSSRRGRSASAGADELIPLMAYVLVRARIEHAASSWRLCERWLLGHPELLLGPLGFGLATLEAAVRPKRHPCCCPCHPTLEHAVPAHACRCASSPPSSGLTPSRPASRPPPVNPPPPTPPGRLQSPPGRAGCTRAASWVPRACRPPARCAPRPPRRLPHATRRARRPPARCPPPPPSARRRRCTAWRMHSPRRRMRSVRPHRCTAWRGRALLGSRRSGARRRALSTRRVHVDPPDYLLMTSS